MTKVRVSLNTFQRLNKTRNECLPRFRPSIVLLAAIRFEGSEEGTLPERFVENVPLRLLLETRLMGGGPRVKDKDILLNLLLVAFQLVKNASTSMA